MKQREIKYQYLIREDDGKWVDCPNLLKWLDGVPQIEKGCHLRFFTGLKDSEGVEIYEGDIVYQTAQATGDFTGVVVMDPGQWMIRTPRGMLYLTAGISRTKVIGNRFTNPELVGE